MRALILIIALSANPAGAQDLADHEGVTLFTEEPCGNVLDLLYGSLDSMEDMFGRFLAAGFILGYDRALGGLHSEDKDTIERLRDSCTQNPGMTAIEILEGF